MILRKVGFFSDKVFCTQMALKDISFLGEDFVELTKSGEVVELNVELTVEQENNPKKLNIIITIFRSIMRTSLVCSGLYEPDFSLCRRN